MFKKILIANRGEIACRIIRTCRKLNIHTVAIYSNVDKHSLHVQEADSAFCVGDSPAKNSYLNISSIMDVARRSQAEAIHPGYGFLSENPAFAKACEEAQLVFIGPSIYALEAMASKQLAKQLLESTAVPLTPGYHGKEQSKEILLQEAKKIGFPVLLKAANGGGGKGMRSVFEEALFEEALMAARREALASFADDTMLIEKLILKPRHIEIQIMADNHGQVVHLFERDCSIQRRHQKIIEEAPAPNLSTTLRQNLAQSACEVARSIQYRGAGTVEFLVDENENFYFMEMNTRLQVEHPVTEMITGFDLVEWQIKIAANEPIPSLQEQIKRQGHAIECRIYAEDPQTDFLPSIGQIHFLKEPCGEGIRVDTGVQVNSAISKFYDPMIAKLIAWGETREIALERIKKALKNYVIGGVKNNLGFLSAILATKRFQEAQLSTDFLSIEILDLKQPSPREALLMAMAFDYFILKKNLKEPIAASGFAWQMHLKTHWVWRYKIQNEIKTVTVFPIDDQSFQFEHEELIQLVQFSIKNERFHIQTDELYFFATIEDYLNNLYVYLDSGSIQVERFTFQYLSSQQNKKDQLTAPMPSTIVAILKRKGDRVKEGEGLIILEAMKMEHTLHAPHDGILSEIFYEIGEQVNEGAQLLALKPTFPI